MYVWVCVCIGLIVLVSAKLDLIWACFEVLGSWSAIYRTHFVIYVVCLFVVLLSCFRYSWDLCLIDNVVCRFCLFELVNVDLKSYGVDSMLICLFYFNVIMIYCLLCFYEFSLFDWETVLMSQAMLNYLAQFCITWFSTAIVTDFVLLEEFLRVHYESVIGFDSLLGSRKFKNSIWKKN